MADLRAAGASSASPVEQLDNRLLAARARAEILQAIFDGRFGDKLPNEDRLAEMLNVSRTTVRTALQGLERDGVVTRRRAIGTIVNRHVSRSSLALQRLTGFDWLLQERGHDVEVEVTASWATASDEAAELLRLAPGAEYFRIEKRYRADGDLALVILDAVAREQFVLPETPEHVPPSLFAFSEAYCRRAIHHAVVEIVPMLKSAEATRLDLADGRPFIRLHETHYTSRGDPVAFSVIDVDDRFITLEVVRTQ
jgi:GntR family transcriptional regulator